MTRFVPVEQVRTIETLRATRAFVRSRIFVRFEMAIQMVSSLIGAATEMAAMRRPVVGMGLRLSSRRRRCAAGLWGGRICFVGVDIIGLAWSLGLRVLAWLCVSVSDSVD